MNKSYNNLQAALAQVKPPKISLNELQGQKYNAQRVEVQQVPEGSTLEGVANLIQSGGEVFAGAVERERKYATEMYEKDKARGLDPVAEAKVRAENEKKTLGGYLHAGFVGDPLIYTKNVAAKRDIENEAFDIDTSIEAKIAQGDFTSMAQVEEVRNKLRKEATKNIAEKLGIEESNPYLSEGLAAKNDKSLKALFQKQTLQTEAQLRTANLDASRQAVSNMVQQGENNPAKYAAVIKNLRKEGSILNDNEERTMWNEVLKAVADSGDVGTLNGLLNQQVTLFGQTASYGDKMQPDVRNALILNAEDNLFKKNKELNDNFSRALTEATLTASNGNPQAALMQLDGMGEWLNQFQTSGQETPQHRMITNVRNQILTTQQRLNAERMARMEKQQEEYSEIIDYSTRIDQALAGDVVALDHTDISGIDKTIQDKAFMGKFDMIMNSSDLSTEQKQQAVYELASIAPRNSELYSALQRSIDGGLVNLDSSLVRSEYEGASEELPESFDKILTMYQNNPVGFSMISTPEQYAKVAAANKQIETLGWVNFQKASNAVGSMTKEQKKAFEEDISLKLEDTYLSTSDQNVIKAGTAAYLPAFKGDYDAAFEASMKDYQEQFSDVGGYDKINNKTLAPRGNSQEIPVVVNALQEKLNELQKANPDAMYTVEENHNGQIVIRDVRLGSKAIATTSNKLYDAEIKKRTDKEVKRVKDLDTKIDEGKDKKELSIFNPQRWW